MLAIVAGGPPLLPPDRMPIIMCNEFMENVISRDRGSPCVCACTVGWAQKYDEIRHMLQEAELFGVKLEQKASDY